MRRPEAGRVSLLALLLVVPLALSPRASRAAEITDTASSFDDDNPFDFRLRVGYQFTTKSASIKREHEGDPSQTQVNVFKDLLYTQTRHQMGLRAEIGIYHDFMFSVEMPLVLSDNRSLSYDQSLGSQCVYNSPNANTPANCVNAQNSSTTNSSVTGDTSDPDPTHYIVPPGGYDALNNGATFAGTSDLVFRGPKRGGSGTDLLDTINFALTYGLLSQNRDDTKPTWTLQLEYQLSIGNVMRFDRANPDANHGVADGLDHIVARTAVSHRFKYLDPYAGFWFDYPFVRRDDTLFIDLGPSAKNQIPQMAGGTIFGLEIIPYESADKGYKVSFDLNARIQGKFDGRGYSEIWEMLATSPALGCDPTWNPSCSSSSIDPRTGMAWNGTTKYQGVPYSGLTTIGNYAQFGTEFAFSVQASKYVRFRANFLYQTDQSHFITADDVGTPAVNGDRVASPSEYNPAFRPVINDIGRRYIVENVNLFQFGIWAQMMF